MDSLRHMNTYTMMVFDLCGKHGKLVSVAMSNISNDSFVTNVSQ